MKEDIKVVMKIKRRNKDFWVVDDSLVLNPADAISYLECKFK